MQIEIDFEVYKGLTSRRRDEGHSYNDVIRELLGLQAAEASGDGTDIAIPAPKPGKRSFESRGVSLPHGTQLKATYKGRLYTARINDGRWVDSDGREHSSPSAAASFITGNNVNGLHFWEAKTSPTSDWWKLLVIGMLG